MEQKDFNMTLTTDDYERLKANSRCFPPKRIIAEGISLSTGVKDEEKIKPLVEKAMKAESIPNDKKYDVFLFGIAESIDSIKSGVSSENEYFEWIDKAQHIMLRMTDGNVTVADIDEKNGFIEKSYQRETELLVCLALYEKSNHPLAKERYAALKLKLQRIRQLRSLLKSSTKARVDKNAMTPEDRARIACAIRSLDEMKEDDEKNYENKALQQMLRHLEMDIEFYNGYSFYTRMLEEQRYADFQESKNRIRDYAEYLEDMRSKEETKEQIHQRIQNLRGVLSERSENQSRGGAFNIKMFHKLRDMAREDDD